MMSLFSKGSIHAKKLATINCSTLPSLRGSYSAKSHVRLKKSLAGPTLDVYLSVVVRVEIQCTSLKEVEL